MKLQKQRVNIFYGYAWKDLNGKRNVTSEEAFKKIRNFIYSEKKIDKKKVNFRRLRASAGGILFLDIYSMIKDADIVIFDITYLNPNVLIELGIAYGAKLSNETRTEIFIIKDPLRTSINIPSDLQGFFITSYSKKNRITKFSDNNSLLQSIKSQVIATLSEISLDNSNIDEID